MNALCLLILNYTMSMLKVLKQKGGLSAKLDYIEYNRKSIAYKQNKFLPN